jgi:hypothetical protein
MFVIIFVIVTALMMTTTYIITANVLSDTYRYQTILNRANEKIRLAGAIGGGTLYYGIRNIGLSSVVVKELGVVDTSNRRSILITSLELKPGDAYVSTTGAIYGTLYAVTERGNTFSTQIIRTDLQSPALFTLTGLTPAFAQQEIFLPNSPNPTYAYTVSMTTYAYIYAFLSVKDPNTDNNILLTLGPYNVPQLYKAKTIPLNDQKSSSSGTVSASLSISFGIYSYNNQPYYQIRIGFTANNINNGLIIRGGFGIIWRTITNNIYTLNLANNIGGGSCDTHINDNPNANSWNICDQILTSIIPSSLDIGSIVAYLATNRPQQSMFAPTGSQAYITFSRIFTIEANKLSSVSTSSQSFIEIYSGRIYLYLNYPGQNSIDKLGSLQITPITVRASLDPQIYVLTIINQI